MNTEHRKDKSNVRNVGQNEDVTTLTGVNWHENWVVWIMGAIRNERYQRPALKCIQIYKYKL